MIPAALVVVALASALRVQVMSPAPRDSLEELERQLAEHPGDRSAQFALGFALVREELQLDRARELFEAAERDHGPHWYSALELGVIHELEGDLRGASSQYRRSLEISRAQDPRPAGSEVAEEEFARVERAIGSILTVADAEARVRRDSIGVVAVLAAVLAAATWMTRAPRE